MSLALAESATYKKYVADLLRLPPLEVNREQFVNVMLLLGIGHQLSEMKLLVCQSIKQCDPMLSYLFVRIEQIVFKFRC